MHETESRLPYRIRGAVDPIAVVASVPHSGLYVPPRMRSGLTEHYQMFLPHQDWHLDRLYSFLPALGVTTLLATHSRYVADPNRGLDGKNPGSFWRAVVPDTAPRNEPLYAVPPTEQEVAWRMREIYHPYHECLEALLGETVNRFGFAYLLDLHSFGLPGDYRVCFGDANGQSCREPLVAGAEHAWASEGFEISRNKPFNGGYIVRRFARMLGVEALQIEVSYSLYLDPDDLDRREVPDPDAPALLKARPRFRRAMEGFLESIDRRTIAPA